MTDTAHRAGANARHPALPSLADIDACRAVVRAYHEVIDRGHATAANRYLAPGAVIEMRGKHLSGDDITAFLLWRESQQDRHTAHVLVDLPLVTTSRSSVTLGGLLLLHVRNEAGTYEVERVLDVTHRLEHSDGGWLIVERTARPLHPPLDAGSHGHPQPGGEPDGTSSD